jgi:uncharacterized protein (TIGR03435 family)
VIRRALLLLLIVLAAFAQEFEVATIRPNRSGSGYSGSDTAHGRFRATNTPLTTYIRIAWELKEFQITGPAWIDSDRFDINAEGPDTPGTLRPMLRALIEDRFQLRFHRETKLMTVYELRTAPGGFKLKQLEGDTDGGTDNGRGRLSVHKASLTRFAQVLSRQTDYPVIDRTGLAGNYEFFLEWTPDEKRTADTDVSSAPSLITALQEQLGLKLQPTKAPVEMFVVDSATRTPEEN